MSVREESRWEGTDGCGAAPSSNRADRQGSLSCQSEPQSPLRLLVLILSNLTCFPKLNHVSTTTNLTMMLRKKKNQELALFPSQVLHSTL